MARRKDLAGLATLAGLAYMASRDKGGGPAPAPAAATPDTGGDFIEAGSGASDGEAPNAMDAMTSGEYGGPNAAKKVAPSATPRPTPVKPMGGSGRGKQGGATAEELAAYAASKPKYQSLQDRARSYEEERAKSGVGMYGTRKSVRREPLPTADDMAYKKGGSVKGWGAARGARKAKIY